MRDKSRLPASLCAVAAVLAVLVYLNALGNPFVWDDRRMVVENQSIRTPIDLRAVLQHDMFRPLVNLTYAADYAVGGLSVTGYHVTSIALHTLNVVLLFLVTRRVAATFSTREEAALEERPPKGRRRGGRDVDPPAARDPSTITAFATASIFAVHPVMTQAVGYVSGRAEVLSTLFFLLAFLAAEAWGTRSRARCLVVVVVAWALALASKEVAIVLPFVLAAHWLFWPETGLEARRRVLRLAGVLLAVMAVAAAFRLATLLRVENATRARFLWDNTFIGLDMVRRYTSLMVLPIGQSIFHSATLASITSPTRVLLNAAWITCLCGLAMRWRRSVPAAGFGILWFLLLLLPSSLLLVLDIGEVMAEQRVYLAACGFALVCGAAYARLVAWPRLRALGGPAVAYLLLGAHLATLASMTVVRNRVWHDPVWLWSEAVVREPRVWVPYVGLGDVLRERGDFAAAARAYREAVRLRPDEGRTYLPLATSLLMSGDLVDADTYFARAEEHTPDSVEARTGRALVARLAGRRDEARDRFLAILQAHPTAILPRQFLAEMYEQEYADRAAALRICREIQGMAPNTPGVGECVRRNGGR